MPITTSLHSTHECYWHRDNLSKPGRFKATFGKSVLTPVRRSVRLERISTQHPSVVQEHDLTVRKLEQLPENVQNNLLFKPNFAVNAELNEAWTQLQLDFDQWTEPTVKFLFNAQRDWQNTFAEVSLYRGSLPYILLLLGRRISFVLPRTSLYSETCIKRTPLGNAVVSA